MAINPDSFHDQNHDLIHEFPEYADRISDLCDSDDQFNKLCIEYNHINREVIRIECHVEPRDHFFCENLKKDRLRHKDMIYAMLRGELHALNT